MRYHHYIFLSILFILSQGTSQAQKLGKELTDTFYYGDDWSKIRAKYATYYRTPVEQVGDKYLVKYFKKDGTPYKESYVKAVKIDYHYSIEPAVAINDSAYKLYYTNGSLMWQGVYNNGQEVGEWKMFFINSTQPKIVEYYYPNQPFVYKDYYYKSGVKYKTGKVVRAKFGDDTVYRKSGTWTYSYPDGKTSSIRNYTLGYLDGYAVIFDSLGKKLFDGWYKMDKRDSIWITYHRSTQTIRTKTFYNNGLLDGEILLYSEDGVLSNKAIWRNGVRVGRWLGYYTDGETIKEATDFDNNMGHYVGYDSASHKVVVKGDILRNKRVGTWTHYYPNGSILSTEVYNNGVLDDLVTVYDDKGNIFRTTQVRNGEIDGKETVYYPHTKDIWIVSKFTANEMTEMKTYHRNGKLKRKIEKESDIIKNEVCYGLDGKKSECTPINISATFKEDVMNYIGRNIRYPESAKLERKEGKVKVAFTIDEFGAVRNPYIIKGFDEDCDAEALRLIAQMPPWNPMLIDDVPLASHKTLPIVFWLPEEED